MILTANVLEVDWDSFNDPDKLISDIDAEVYSSDSDEGIRETGTRLVIRGLSEDWTQKRLKELVNYEFARLTDPFEKGLKRPRVAIFWNGEREAIPRMPQELLNAAHATLKADYKIIDGNPVCSYHNNYKQSRIRTSCRVTKWRCNQRRLAWVSWYVLTKYMSLPFLMWVPSNLKRTWFNRKRLTKIDSIGDLEQVRKLPAALVKLNAFSKRLSSLPIRG